MKRLACVVFLSAWACLAQLPKPIPYSRANPIPGVQSGEYIYCASAVGTDSYACNLVPPIVAYTTGMVVNLRADVVNTGACTLALNGLAAKAIKRGHDVDPVDGEIEIGTVVTLVYDGTNFQMQSQTGLAGGAPGGFSNLTTANRGAFVSAAGTVTENDAFICSASPLLCTFYDPTAVTGLTRVYIRAAADQNTASTPVLSFGTSAGAAMGFRVSNAGNIEPAESAFSMATGATGTLGVGTAGRTGNTTPSQKLDVFGGNIKVADPSSLAAESLSETGFTTHVKWDVTGDFDDTGGNAVYLHNTGVGTLTQTAANQATAAVGSRGYKFAYTLSGVTAGATCQITTLYALTAQTLDLAAGVAKEHFFDSAVAPTNFVISCTSTGGGFTLDDVSLKQITGGNMEVHGMITGGGTSGLKVQPDGKVFILGYTGSDALGVTGNVYASTRFETPGYFTDSSGYLLDPSISDALTATSAYHLLTRHASSGTPGAGFGSGWKVNLETATASTYEDAGTVELAWTSAVAGATASKWNFYITIASVLTNTVSINNGISLNDPGTSANSYALTLTADNAATPQYATFQVMYGADPYLRVSAPNDAGVATGVLDIHDSVIAVVSDGAVALGALGANRFSSIYASVGFGAAGIAGASATVVVKGSDGNNCNLVYTGGLYTSTTCP